MKKILFIISTLIFFITSYANNYFVRTGGNDLNSGLDNTNAWATISKVNSFNYPKGTHTVYFNRGNTWTGNTLIAGRANITFGAYGNGNKPVISGFTTIAGWTKEGGGIYSKIISSDAQTNMVTIDGVQYGMGRYPDASYLTYESFSTNVAIIDYKLGSTTNWTGAEAAIRKNDWAIDRCLITNHTGDTLTYKSHGNNGDGTASFGYFIQNDLRTLTTYGEWYHDTGTGKFFMYFGGINPNTKTVKVATLNRLAYINGSTLDNVNFDNINFTGAIKNAIDYQDNQDNCTVSNCDIAFAGGTGINFNSNGVNNTITNNKISCCNSYGIYDDGGPTTITNNEIIAIGLIKGQSQGADGHTGIYSTGLASVLRNNNIHSTGGTGIVIKYTGAILVDKNRIDSCNLVIDDGGCIYTAGPNSSTRTISNNILSNSIGNTDGTNHPANTLSEGIYLDEHATNVVVTGNTVFGCTNSGIKLHMANNCTITNNTFYNNKYGLYSQDDDGTTVNTSIRRNLFFAKISTQYIMAWITNNDNIHSFGTADSNYYTRPVNETAAIGWRQKNTGYSIQWKTLAQWKTLSGQDAHSQNAAQTISTTSALDFQTNPSNAIFRYWYNGKSKKTTDGVVFNNYYDIPAWSSVILFSNGTTSAVTGKNNIIRTTRN